MAERIVRSLRRALLRAAGNEALYLIAAFCSASVLSMGPLAWYREATGMFFSLIVVPWGAALCLLTLERRARLDPPRIRADLAVLFALFLWILVPFAIRFGITFNTAYSWYNHLVLFFGVYAAVTQADKAHFERVIDLACALFAALSFALGVPAMRAVFAAGTVGPETGGIVYGLDAENCLSFGLHYNTTGMIAVCCALSSLAGACRRKNPFSKLLHFAAFSLMALCVVLSQSRTSRYALLGALAAGCFGYAGARLPIRHAAMRHAAALCGALVVLVSSYAGASSLMGTALSHYARTQASGVTAGAAFAPALSAQEPLIPSARAEEGETQPSGAREEAAPETAQAESDQSAPAARPAIDATFSERTLLWRNLFDLWKREPKRFILGNGMGNTGSLIVAGTASEGIGAIAVHNSYLQFIADYGIVGFALLAAFLLMLLPAAARVLLSPQSRGGDRVFVMIAAAQLLTALMESQPLGAMSSTSLALFFALAVIRVRDASLRGVALL